MNEIDSPIGLNIDKYRIIIEGYGILLGKQVYTVGVKNADPKYNEKLRNGLSVPNKPIRLFNINKINVLQVGVEIDGSNQPVVVFNAGTGNEFRCQVTKPEFKDVKIATVREAIEASEKNCPPLFFKNCDALTKEICQLNIQERNRANDFAKEMAQQASLLDDTVAIQQEDQRRYYASLNQSTAIEMEVNVSTE